MIKYTTIKEKPNEYGSGRRTKKIDETIEI